MRVSEAESGLVGEDTELKKTTCLLYSVVKITGVPLDSIAQSQPVLNVDRFILVIYISPCLVWQVILK